MKDGFRIAASPVVKDLIGLKAVRKFSILPVHGLVKSKIRYLRVARQGELVQLDGSPHNWLEGFSSESTEAY